MGSDPRLRRWVGVALSIVSLGVRPSVAAERDEPGPSASDRETARALMRAGDAHLSAEAPAEALRAYRAADALMHLPPTGLAVARALERLGHLVEARDAALQVVRLPTRETEPAPWTQARAAAAALARALEPRISGLVVDAPGARIEIDDAPQPEAAAGLVRKLNPGLHVVRAHAPGRESVRLEVVLAEGETRTVHLTLPPASVPGLAPTTSAPATSLVAPEVSPPADGTASTLLWVGVSAAATGVAVGTVSGVIALAKARNLQATCPPEGCPAERRADYDAAHRAASVSTVAFLVGLGGLGLGALGYFSLDTGPPGAEPGQRRSAPDVLAWPMVAPGRIGVEGRY